MGTSGRLPGWVCRDQNISEQPLTASEMPNDGQTAQLPRAVQAEMRVKLHC